MWDSGSDTSLFQTTIYLIRQSVETSRMVKGGWMLDYYLFFVQRLISQPLAIIHIRPCRMSVHKSMKPYTLRTPQPGPLSLEVNMPHIRSLFVNFVTHPIYLPAQSSFPAARISSTNESSLPRESRFQYPLWVRLNGPQPSIS